MKNRASERGETLEAHMSLRNLAECQTDPVVSISSGPFADLPGFAR